jgi:hypothetical protein
VTVVPLVALRELELAAQQAKIAEAAHRSPSGQDCPGCEHCLELAHETDRAQRRLNAARSQQPIRHIFTSGAELRRRERERHLGLAS